ncbi:coiled-coil domain-containing protein 15 isoform X2 [Larus michahellis]|uniref:coiled-coil domain-containing protein 15 isoform X2 n=1 Tax=Larus michahellis TaxID=119627 RepID=UPI003D9B9EC8
MRGRMPGIASHPPLLSPAKLIAPGRSRCAGMLPPWMERRQGAGEQAGGRRERPPRQRWRVLAERNPSVAPVGAWVESGPGGAQQSLAFAAASRVEEELKEREREKAASLRRFQGEVKQRVNRQVRTRRKQQLQESCEAAERESCLAARYSASALRSNPRKNTCLFRSRPAPAICGPAAPAQRLGDHGEPFQQRAAQLSKTVKQVRRRLASRRTVPPGAGPPELPGGGWRREKPEPSEMAAAPAEDEREELLLAGHHDLPAELQDPGTAPHQAQQDDDFYIKIEFAKLRLQKGFYLRLPRDASWPALSGNRKRSVQSHHTLNRTPKLRPAGPAAASGPAAQLAGGRAASAASNQPQNLREKLKKKALERRKEPPRCDSWASGLAKRGPSLMCLSIPLLFSGGLSLSVSEPCDGSVKDSSSPQPPQGLDAHHPSPLGLWAGVDREETKKQRQTQYLRYRRLFMNIEREQVKEQQRRRERQKRIAGIKSKTEKQRRAEERRMQEAADGQEPSLGEGACETLAQLKLEERRAEKVKDKRQRNKEYARYVDALRAQTREKIKLYNIDLPPLCSCGSDFWGSHPDTCANNCVFYQNPKAYSRALLSLLSSCVPTDGSPAALPPLRDLASLLARTGQRL